MLIYILHFVLNMILGAMIIPSKKHANGVPDATIQMRKKVYLFLTTLQLGLLCGFRSTLMAYDTEEYKIIFDMCPDTWGHIFDESSYVEVGFRVLCSLIKIFGGEFQTLLIVTSLFIIGSCCVFIYRHSKNVVLSVFIIVSFPFFYSSFDIVRHFIATAFFLLGYRYIVERKFFRYLLFIAVGSLFHSIAWVFLPIYFMSRIKWNMRTFALAAIGTVALYVYIEPIAVWLGRALGKSDGIKSGWVGSYGGGILTAFMYCLLLVIAVFAYYQLEDKRPEDATAVNYMVLMVIFAIVFINARIMTRMIMTTVPLIAIAIPQLIDEDRTTSPKDCFLLKAGFVSIGVGYHLFMLFVNWQNVVPYIPFWR